MFAGTVSVGGVVSRTVTVTTVGPPGLMSSTDTVKLPWLATYARVPSGLTATPNGFTPTGTVALTVLVAVLMTDTVLLPRLATYARVPSGLTATPIGND